MHEFHLVLSLHSLISCSTSRPRKFIFLTWIHIQQVYVIDFMCPEFQNVQKSYDGSREPTELVQHFA